MRKFSLLFSFLFIPLLSALLTKTAIADVDLFQEDRLIKAVKSDDLRMGEVLLQRQHNVNVRDKIGRTPLLIAAAKGHEDFIELLIRFRPSVNEQDNYGNTALYYAAAGGHIGVMELLLDFGAAVDLQNRQGLTPLMIAASEGSLAAIQTLLEGGAGQHITDFTGRTALDWGRRYNRRNVIRMLEKTRFGD